MENSNLDGRLFIRKEPSDDMEVPSDSKFPSPLKRSLAAHLDFVDSAVKDVKQNPKMATTLSKLLTVIGLEDRAFKSDITPTLQEASIIPSILEVQQQEKQRSHTYSMFPVKYEVKVCQTDPVVCDECEFRNSIKFVNEGTQCDAEVKIDIGTQVSEEDLPRFSLKQSFSHLTPAQLLAQNMRRDNPHVGRAPDLVSDSLQKARSNLANVEYNSIPSLRKPETPNPIRERSPIDNEFYDDQMQAQPSYRKQSFDRHYDERPPKQLYSPRPLYENERMNRPMFEQQQSPMHDDWRPARPFFEHISNNRRPFFEPPRNNQGYPY